LFVDAINYYRSARRKARRQDLAAGGAKNQKGWSHF